MAWSLDSSRFTLDSSFYTLDGSSPWATVDGLVAGTLTSTGAIVGWNAAVNPEVVGYKLRLTLLGTPTIIDAHAATFFVLTGLLPNTTYLLEVAAYDSAGALSTWSPGSITFTTLSISGVNRMLPQYVFGPGVAWITQNTDAFGNTISNPSPILIAAMQDVSLDMSAEVKELYGTNSFAIAIGRGKQKLGIKIKNAQVHGRLWNSLFFGQTLTAGIYNAVYDVTGAAIPGTPFQITPTVPGSGTFGYDLGVRDVNNLPFARVASAPATGQYSVTSGVYLFASADTGKTVYISYNYTATSTVAQKLAIQNLPMGFAPTFQFDLTVPYNGNVLNATFPNCMATKVALATKLDDFAYPEFDISAFAPGSAGVGTLSWSQ
jgi:hypothetical protein